MYATIRLPLFTPHLNFTNKRRGK